MLVKKGYLYQKMEANNNPQLENINSPNVVQDPTSSIQQFQPEIQKKSNKFLKVLLYGLVSLFLVATGVFGFWIYKRKTIKKTESSASPSIMPDVSSLRATPKPTDSVKSTPSSFNSLMAPTTKSNKFRLDEVKVGDQVGDVKVESIELFRKDWPVVNRSLEVPVANAKVNFSGSSTITGSYFYTSPTPKSEDIICFGKLDEESQSKIPQIIESGCESNDFCFSNQDFAKNKLSSKTESDKVTIVIDKLTFNCYPTSPMSHSAELISVLE